MKSNEEVMMSGISHCGTSGKGRWLVADSSSVLWTEHTPRVFFGWWVVAASALGLVVSYGPIVLATFGVFLGPLHREFGWSRSELSGAVSVATLLVAFFQPMCGRLVDRWGTRRVVVLSLALFGSTLLALSALRSLWHFYLGYMLLGLFGTGTTPVSYSRLFGQDRRDLRPNASGAIIFVHDENLPRFPNGSEHCLPIHRAESAQVHHFHTDPF
jgi:MFS family permease